MPLTDSDEESEEEDPRTCTLYQDPRFPSGRGDVEYSQFQQTNSPRFMSGQSAMRGSYAAMGRVQFLQNATQECILHPDEVEPGTHYPMIDD